ncbi:MAG: helicase C-terminal domain-containing protein [Spirochaetales bacterium]
MHAFERLSPDAVLQAIQAIEEAEGNEVLLVGTVDESGVVESVTAVARGHLSAVPAPRDHMRRGNVVIHNHPSGALRPSEADLSVASELATQGIGSYIVDNAVRRVYPVVEPVVEEEPSELDADELAAVLEPGGAAERLLETFEPREPQLSMLRLVCQSFNEEVHAVCEAGTGVGKSFAYLIPAIRWAAENGERVVISTATITLQQQLIERDIPTVQRLLGTELKAVLVKGRGNYLCSARLGEALSEQSELFEDHQDPELETIREWARTTETGSRSDLPIHPRDEVWSQVNADGDSCSPSRCRNNDCFLMKARRRAGGAQILVANHHLLFSDLNLRIAGIGFDATAVLPPFQRLILDEAHTIERIATSYFSEEIVRFGVLKTLRRIYRSRGKRSVGLAVRLGSEIGDTELAGNVGAAIGDVEAALDELDERALRVCGERESIRLVDIGSDEVQRDIIDPAKELERQLGTLAEVLAEGVHRIEDEDSPVAVDARGAIRRIEAFASVCSKIPEYLSEREETVFYIERVRTRRGQTAAKVVLSPLDVSNLMVDAVYRPFRTVVCTSATLTVAKRFDNWKRRVGFARYGEEILEGVFDSPFDYASRVMLATTSDAPMPSLDSYIPYLVSFLSKLLVLTDGRALVLFTSYRMLQAVYDELRPVLDANNIPCLRQGEDERSRLLTSFRDRVSSVLLATDSFWEGVDTPGSSLEVVVLCRLPFGVPTHPVSVSRAEAVERRGGNPFMELSLPDAVVRFKQGFGRLMRRGSDRGIVVVTDPRITRKQYGSLFTSSLPQTRREDAPSDILLERIERFYFSG